MAFTDRSADAPVEPLASLDTATTSPSQVPQLVEGLLELTRSAGASDLHLVPTADGLDVRWRVDGLLRTVAHWPPRLAPNVVARLKVLADLLTYRTDVPQEGRLRTAGPAPATGSAQMRLSTFPTLHGEKAVVRFFAAGRESEFDHLSQLGLPPDVEETLHGLLGETAGVLVVAGPSGSGKTTTLYACLRALLGPRSEAGAPATTSVDGRGGRSIVSLEDPIERSLPGVDQAQVDPAAGFDLAVGIRALLRQDPDVLMIGEIRDPETAASVFQASLTGHLVLTSFHAGSAAEAVRRLGDFGTEPYLLRTSLRAVLWQRLVRKLCECSRPADEGSRTDAASLGLTLDRYRLPVGCPKCLDSGYHGRSLLCEFLRPDLPALGAALTGQVEARQLERLAAEGGMITRWDRGRYLVEQGVTSPAELRRVLGRP